MRGFLLYYKTVLWTQLIYLTIHKNVTVTRERLLNDTIYSQTNFSHYLNFSHHWHKLTVNVDISNEISQTILRWLPIVFRPHARWERSLNLRRLHALKGKRQCFSIFYVVNMTTKSKTDSEFSRVSFGEVP